MEMSDDCISESESKDLEVTSIEIVAKALSLANHSRRVFS